MTQSKCKEKREKVQNSPVTSLLILIYDVIPCISFIRVWSKTHDLVFFSIQSSCAITLQITHSDSPKGLLGSCVIRITVMKVDRN